MLLIKNALLMDPASNTQGDRDILIDNGIIRSIVPAGEAAATGFCDVIDAAGLICAPGLVDTHSHFRDPGFPLKEDIYTGAASAAKGGYTSVIMMANTKPSIDCVEILDQVLKKGAETGIHVYSAANVTLGMRGKELTDMEALKEHGARVFTDDGVPVLNEDLLRSALKKAASLNMPVSLHEEDPAYISENGIHAGGPAAEHLGIRGSAREAEISMIERDLKIAVETDAALCIQHISTAEGVALVREAKKRNPRITAEATPHHFSLTEEAVIERGSLAKVNPPIRTEKDRLSIIEGLADGTIDIIATDHAPHTKEEKSVQPLWKAPSGMIGLETALSLGIRELVNPGYLTMMELLRRMSTNPADYYSLPAGRIFEGGPADLCLFDPAAEWTVGETFASRSSNSPFIGQTMPGVIRHTICGGKIIL